jgi:hypothetical protein
LASVAGAVIEPPVGAESSSRNVRAALPVFPRRSVDVTFFGAGGVVAVLAND